MREKEDLKSHLKQGNYSLHWWTEHLASIFLTQMNAGKNIWKPNSAGVWETEWEFSGW